MACEGVASLGAHHDEIGLRFASGNQNLFGRIANRDAAFRLAPVFRAIRHKLFHAGNIDFLLARDTLFGVSGGTFDNVEQSQVRAVFLREGERMRGGLFCARTEIGGEKDIRQLDFLPAVALDRRTDGEDGGVGLPEDLFGNRTDENLLNFTAAMRAADNKGDFVLHHQLFQGRPDVSFFHQNFVRDAAELSGDENVGDAFFGGLADFLVGGLSELGSANWNGSGVIT